MAELSLLRCWKEAGEAGEKGRGDVLGWGGLYSEQKNGKWEAGLGSGSYSSLI